MNTDYFFIYSSSNNNLNMSKADMARSLLYLVSNDIGQISTLYAMMHNVKNIYFGGFFLRHHPVSLHTISYAVNYWSKGKNKVILIFNYFEKQMFNKLFNKYISFLIAIFRNPKYCRKGASQFSKA